MAKNITPIRTKSKKSFLQRVAEMVGRVSPVDNFLRKNSLIWDLYTSAPTVDYSKTNYTLTKAIYYASKIDEEGTCYGDKFLFGAALAKPIVNSTAAFAFSSPPSVSIDGFNGTTSEIKEDTNDNYQKFIDEWIENNDSLLFKVARNCLRDGDYYILVNDDLSARLIAPEQVDVVDDPITGETLGYDVTTYVENIDENGVKKRTKYVSKYRKKSPYYQLIKFEENSKEGSIEVEEKGDDEERPLRIIGFHNERDANERYGTSEYQGCYYLMANYHAVLEAAIENNLYNSNAVPIVTGVDDVQRWLETNGTKNENGEYVVNWENKKLLIGTGDFDAKIIGGIQNSAEAMQLLNIIFWLICQQSETPEFVMGTAVQSSKASVSEQMPVMIMKAQRKRKEFKNFYKELFELVFHLGKERYPELAKEPKISISWPDIVEEDKKINIEIVKTLSEEGCISDRTKMIMLGIDKYVNDINGEIDIAKKENSEKSQSALSYGPSSIFAKTSGSGEVEEKVGTSTKKTEESEEI